MRYFFTLIAVLCVIVCVSSTKAGPGQDSIAFQGSLTDPSNIPVSDGPRDLTISIWTDSVGGTMLHSEVAVVTTSKGLFSTCVGCGSSTFPDIFTGQTLFLETQLAGQPPMAPRTRLRGVPYSMSAARVRGDISTNPGFVIVGDSAAGGSVRVKAGLENAGGVVAQGASLRITGDPDFDLLRLSADPDSAKIRISGQSSGDPDFDLLRIQGGVGPSSQGASVAITGDPDFDLLRLSADPDSAKIRISGQNSGDPDFDLLRIQGGVGTTSQGASVAITGDPDFDLLRLSADADTAKIRISAQSTGDPDFDLLRITGGSGEAHLSMHSAPSTVVGVANTWKDDDCDGISARSILGGMSGSTTGTIRMQAKPDSALSALEHDDNNDGHPNTTLKGIARGGNGNYTVSWDFQGDGDPESEISQNVTPTTSRVAIKTKGTGADPRRSAMVSATGLDSASLVCMQDLDGDGHDDASVKIASGASLLGGALPGGAVISARCDSDDDGTNDNEASMIVTPTTSSVAIKVKGTGADKDRRAGSTCDDSSAVDYLDLDDDGDGISEAKAVSSVSSLGGGGGGGGAASASYAATGRWYTDSDDDGIPEGDISQSVTPTTCSVAIKTKGTGADANRTASVTSTTNLGNISTVSAIDDDGDGIPESEVSQSVTPTTSSMAIKHKGTGADKDGVTIRSDTAGSSTEVEAAAKNIGLHVRAVTGQCDLTMTDASSGTTDTTIIIDGATKRVGIGVSQPVHPLHHSSGAHLTSGGVWTNASDADLKENFQPVDGNKLLDKIGELPISQWNYKSESEDVTHIGPTAQDFQKVFGVGENDKTISTIDPSGIALAAIKELNKRNEKLNSENQLLRKEMDELKKLVQKLASRK